MNPRRLVVVPAALLLVGWIALMVSFWLPWPVGDALRATAIALIIPGGVATAGIAIFWNEIADMGDRQKTVPLRCTDCGGKILNPAGTTIGDQIEGELMVGQWTPPKDASPFDRGGR